MFDSDLHYISTKLKWGKLPRLQIGSIWCLFILTVDAFSSRYYRSIFQDVMVSFWHICCFRWVFFCEVWKYRSLSAIVYASVNDWTSRSWTSVRRMHAIKWLLAYGLHGRVKSECCWPLRHIAQQVVDGRRVDWGRIHSLLDPAELKMLQRRTVIITACPSPCPYDPPPLGGSIQWCTPFVRPSVRPWNPIY